MKLKEVLDLLIMFPIKVYIIIFLLNQKKKFIANRQLKKLNPLLRNVVKWSHKL